MDAELQSMPEGKRQLGRSRHRCEKNIKINLKTTVFLDMNWIHQAWNGDLNTAINTQI
jgi:hypothetical protein